MNKNYVIAQKLLPVKSPIGAIWLTGLTMHTFNSPSWMWGAWGVLSLIVFASFVWVKYNEQEIDIKINK